MVAMQHVPHGQRPSLGACNEICLSLAMTLPLKLLFSSERRADCQNGDGCCKILYSPNCYFYVSVGMLENFGGKNVALFKCDSYMLRSDNAENSAGCLGLEKFLSSFILFFWFLLRFTKVCRLSRILRFFIMPTFRMEH